MAQPLKTWVMRKVNSCVGGRPLPEQRWLARDWIRAYLQHRTGDLTTLQDLNMWSSPLAREHLPQHLAPELVALWRDREHFLEGLDDFPRTVCHLDLHPANVFGRDGQTVLIDWSFIGLGVVGEDPANLIPDAVLDFHVEPALVEELYDVVLDGYLRGLHRAGWTGPDHTVVAAIDVLIAVKFSWLAPSMLVSSQHPSLTINGKRIDAALAVWAQLLPFLVKCAQRTREYLAQPRLGGADIPV